MYYKQDETFTFEGMRLVCKRAPRRFWPCQSCALAGSCRTGEEGFPECRPECREDYAQVVFFEDAQRRQPRKREAYAD